MTRSDYLSNTATGILVLCAVALTTSVVRREFFPGGASNTQRGWEQLSAEDWQRAIRSGQRIGPYDAPVTVVTFSDFECPYCERFAVEGMAPIRRRYPSEVAFIFRHKPLRKHPYAVPAAIASECAAAQGRFEEFHDALFAHADSLGKRPFATYAAESGIANLVAFKECVETGSVQRTVDFDLAVADSLNVTGTPTIFANGWRVAARPDSARLDSLVTAELRRVGKGRR